MELLGLLGTWDMYFIDEAMFPIGVIVGMAVPWTCDKIVRGYIWLLEKLFTNWN